MAELLEQNRTDVCLMDISKAVNSVQACHLAEAFVSDRLAGRPPGIIVDVNAGDLLLTRGVLARLKQMVRRAGGALGVVYATVPQTQQAALDEGVFVKETRAGTEAFAPLRQPLPYPARDSATLSIASSEHASSEYADIHLPDFFGPRHGAEILPAEAPVSAKEATEATPVAAPALQGPPEAALTDALTEIIEDAPVESSALGTLYYRQNLRSGQIIRFGGHVVLVGDAHAGSEILADGDIMVWGELRGIAHAGAQGNYKAEIRAMRIEALQLRIADYIARRPDRIYAHKDAPETLSWTPETARVADGEIKVFKAGYSA